MYGFFHSSFRIFLVFAFLILSQSFSFSGSILFVLPLLKSIARIGISHCSNTTLSLSLSLSLALNLSEILRILEMVFYFSFYFSSIFPSHSFALFFFLALSFALFLFFWRKR